MARFKNGFVLIPRDILSSCKDVTDLGLLTYLILEANFRDSPRPVLLGDDSVIIKRGELLTKYENLKRAMGLEPSTTSRRLKKLAKRGEVATRLQAGKTIITVCNYEEMQCIENYQNSDRATDVQRPCNDHATGVQRPCNDHANIRTNVTKETNETKGTKGTKGNDSADGASGQKLIAFYCEKYKQRFSINPVLTGKEIGAMKNILKTLSLERAQELINGYFELSDAWIVQRMYPLELLQNASIMNRITAKGNGVDVSAKRAREYETTDDAQKIVNKMFGGDKK
jgi:hypothetical protein